MLDKQKQYISKENLIAYTQALNTKQEAQNLVVKSDIEELRNSNSLLIKQVTELKSDSLSTKGSDLKITGDLTIAKDDTTNSTGNLIVEGNLEVKGSTVTKDTETILVQDNFIIINSDGEELGTQLSGIGIKTDTNDAYGIAYDPELKSVSLGKGTITNGDFAFSVGESKPILTRDGSENIPDGHLLIWDAKKRIAKDGGAYDLETLKETFATWGVYHTLDKKVEAEISDRTSGDRAVAELIDTTRKDLQSEIDSVSKRITNIEDTDSLVQDMYNSVDAIKEQIVSGAYSADKLWGLTFRSIVTPDGDIVGYEPYFTPMDDGELN